ncbi:MAG: hypothetical protein R2727_07345 [Bacteroidales bacterium]
MVLSGKLDRCQDISNVVSLGINPLPVGAITPLQDESICAGEEISLDSQLQEDCPVIRLQ